MQDVGGVGSSARRSSSPLRARGAELEYLATLQNRAPGTPTGRTSFRDATRPVGNVPPRFGHPRRPQSLGPNVRTATAGAAAATSERPRPPMPKRTATDNVGTLNIDPMIWADSPSRKVHPPHRAATVDDISGANVYTSGSLYSDPLGTASLSTLSSPVSSPFTTHGSWTPPVRSDWRDMQWPRPRVSHSIAIPHADAASAALQQNAEATVAAAIGDDGDDMALTSSPTTLAPLADPSSVPPVRQRSPSPPEDLAQRMFAATLRSSPQGDAQTPPRRVVGERESFVWPRPRHTLATPVRTTDAPLSMYSPFGAVPEVFAHGYAPHLSGGAARLSPDVFEASLDPPWLSAASGTTIGATPAPPVPAPAPVPVPVAAPNPPAFQHRKGGREGREGRFRDKAHRGASREDARSAAELNGRLDIREARGTLVELSIDQHGSRLIQEKLDHCTAEDRDIVFSELYSDALRLMSDVFGNYVIQKLIEHGTLAQVHALCEKLHGNVLKLSLGTYGCRVVQKAFEFMDTPQKVQLGHELEPHVLQCVRDQNANHVVQKILEQLPADEIAFVATAFEGHVSALASHCYSCRVLQRIFAYCHEEQYRPLLKELHRDSLRLMQDQYGNYVVQWVLQNGKPHDRAALIRNTKSRLLQLSRHKFASNVMEQVIEVSSPAERRELLDEMLVPLDTADSAAVPPIPCGDTHVSAAMLMMQDQYANYVLQRILQVATGDDRARLVETIRPVLTELRKHATPGSGTSAFGYGVRLPGGGHIGAKPLLAIERLIEQPPDRTAHRAAPRSRAAH